MAGGLLQLAAVGSQTDNLIANPQLTFFKMVYKHYANFACEPIEVALEGNPELDFEQSVILKCVIDRNADLLSHMYLLIDLPDIYSGYDTSIEPNMGYQFQWIQQIGARMIKHVDIVIGGKQIQRLQGDYIQLWHEMFSATGKDLDTYQQMTGNIPELYNPTGTPWAKGVYPTATLDPQMNVDPELSTSSTSSTIANPYYRTASIRGRTLYIPLPFWFSENSGQALPLVALQKNETQVHIEFRPLKELYRVRDTNPSNVETFGQHIAPQVDNMKHNINTFLPASGRTADEQRRNMRNQENVDFRRTNIATRQQKLNIRPRLLCTYVFLDEKEQQRFASTNHKYLIQKVQYQTEGGIYNTTLFDLQLNHPTKLILWYLQHEDVSLRNDWSNYTNWKASFGVPPSSLDAYIPQCGENVSQIIGNSAIPTHTITNIPLRFPLYHPLVSIAITSKFDYPATEENILKEATILFNGVPIFNTRNEQFFQSVQPYEHNYKTYVPGVYSYSFSLLPRPFQPSGACDMSRVKNVQLQLVTQDTNTDAVLKYSLSVMSVYYNVLDIMGGMAGLEYAD